MCFRKVLYEIGDYDYDAYENFWSFNWREMQQEHSVVIYDMFSVDDDINIQGRVAIRTSSQPYYVMLAENAPQNSPLDNNPNGAKNCDYTCVGKNLFAFAAMLSKEAYGQAFLLWKSKTKLIDYYSSWGATLTRNFHEMYLSPELGDQFIEECRPILGSDQYV